MFRPLTRYYQTHHARIHRLSKEGGWIIAGQIASVLGALVLVRVLTEHLDPAQYGQLALGLTVAGFINQVVMGGVTNGIIRFYSIAAENQDLGGYLHATRHLLAYATVATVAIGLILIASLFWLGYSQWIGLAATALVFAVLSGYNSTLSGIQNAARQRAIVAFHGGLDAWLKIGLALGVMLWLGASSTAVVIGYACSSLLITFSQLIFLRRIIPQRHMHIPNNQQWMSQMLVFSWPFMATNVFGWAQQSSGRWALEMYATTENVGLFSVLSQIGYAPLQIMIGLVMSFMMPIFFARTGDASCSVRKSNVRKLTNKLAMMGLWLTGCAFVVTILWHSFIFKQLVGSEYLLVSHYLPWIVLSGGIFGVAQIYAIRLQALLIMNRLVVSGIAISLFGVFLSVAGAFIYGLAGVVVGSLIFSATYLVLMWYWFFIKT